MVNYADEIKRAVPARELFEHYGFEINRAGFCHSPFAANDKTPSLKVYDGDRGWHDFSSGKGGDIIAFVQDYFGLNFMDACKKLNSDFNLHLPIGEKLTLAQQREADRKAAQRKREQIERKIEHNRLLDAYEKALDRFCELDRMKIDNEPKIMSEPISDKFWYALRHMAEAAYELDEATEKLMEFERGEES